MGTQINIKQGYDQRRKAIYDDRSRHNNPRRSDSRLPHGLLPNDVYMAYACAMVKVALEQNEATRPLWVDIRCAWGKPGCVSFDASYFERDHVLSQWFDKRFARIKEPIPDVVDLMIEANREWEHPDITHLVSLVDSFIVKAFNGPIDPRSYSARGAMTYQERTPKYRVRVTSDTAPLLKLAIFLLSWTEYKSIDLQAVDHENMGADYDLVTSGKKPSVEWGRKRKPKLNEFMRKIGLSYIKESTIYGEAEKWYHARVIRGSVAQAISDYEINNSSTFETLLGTCDHIAGIR